MSWGPKNPELESQESTPTWSPVNTTLNIKIIVLKSCVNLARRFPRTEIGVKAGQKQQDGKPIQWTCGGEMVKYFCSNLERLSPGHIWSQVVTKISVDIKDLKNYGLDDYYFSL